MPIRITYGRLRRAHEHSSKRGHSLHSTLETHPPCHPGKAAAIHGYCHRCNFTQHFLAEIEAELRKLDREEAKLISDMKQAAKTNPPTAKALAKQLVRLRQNRQRMQGSAAQITGINAGLKSQQVRCWLTEHTVVPVHSGQPVPVVYSIRSPRHV